MDFINFSSTSKYINDLQYTLNNTVNFIRGRLLILKNYMDTFSITYFISTWQAVVIVRLELHCRARFIVLAVSALHISELTVSA